MVKVIRRIDKVAALREVLSRHYAVQRVAREHDDEAKRLRDEAVVPAFRAAGVQSTTFAVLTDEGQEITVQASCNPDPDPDWVPDWERLRTAMGAKEWAKVTKQVPDPDKLNQWLVADSSKRGAREQIVASCMTRKPRAPFPRYTVKGARKAPSPPPPDPKDYISPPVEVPELEPRRVRRIAR